MKAYFFLFSILLAACTMVNPTLEPTTTQITETPIPTLTPTTTPIPTITPSPTPFPEFLEPVPPQVFSISQNNEGTYVGYDEYGEEIGRVEGGHWIRINQESQVSHWYDAEVSEWKELLPGIGYMEKFDPENLTFVEWKDIENGLAHNTAWYLIETGKMPTWPSVNLGGEFKVEKLGKTETVAVYHTLTGRISKDAYPQRPMFWIKTEYNGIEAVVYVQELKMTEGQFPIVYIFLEEINWYLRDGWFNDQELFRDSVIFPSPKLSDKGCARVPSHCKLNGNRFPEMVEWTKKVFVERDMSTIKKANYLFYAAAQPK